MDSDICPICNSSTEDSSHIFFHCDMAKSILRKISNWWDIPWRDCSSFTDWYTWFDTIRMTSKLKLMLEGVFFVAWWHIWVFRNRLIFDTMVPRRSEIHDEILSRSFFLVQ